MTDQHLLNRIRRELIVLRSSIALLAILVTASWFLGFSPKGDVQHFGEINVERLNIVDSSGRYCFVLTNGERAPGAIIRGREVQRSNSNNLPAILFFNGEGDEAGALFTAGKKDSDTSYFGSSRLVFDRFQHDETLAFQYYEDVLGGYAGMLVQDTRDMTLEDYVRKSDSVAAMPDGAAKKEAFAALSAQAGPWATKRLFIGKYDRTKAAVLEIMDRKGNSRLVLGVDSLGTPSIDFLNEKGDITYHLSDAGTNKTKK